MISMEIQRLQWHLLFVDWVKGNEHICIVLALLPNLSNCASELDRFFLPLQDQIRESHSGGAEGKCLGRSGHGRKPRTYVHTA